MKTEDHMDLIWTLIIGGIVGWLASIVMRANGQMGILANVVVGIIGAILGQTLAREGGLRIQSDLGWGIVAVAGAALLIAILRSLGIFNRLAAASR
jgi:uncharacterized membrane protein YeaQ/YmgE (transglycosylase-associated protein family)